MKPAALTDAQRERLYELFEAALEVSSTERAAWCSRACGEDESLRAELESLLRVADSADEAFLATPALSAEPEPNRVVDADDGSVVDAETFPQPESIGGYRILERLGEGGMGIVYRAEQSAPVPREVAVKVLKPGLDSERFIRRFELERQALARMQHPGIARIYDAGATDEGRPWLAMELVSGQPIQEHCRDARLRTRERLELFALLCDAVQHAHQRGILHRDLKPSNILVAHRDGRPVPVVIDFGIARAHTESGHTALTRQHERIGTLDYMAPEQGNPHAEDIDSRADIYSLGIVLFELLVGERPFDARELAAAATDPKPSQRTPPAPSTRITTAATAGATADSHRTNVHALRRTLRGELDWITLKALEHDRERRYASASELAADIRRYLADEPVLAGPPGAWYRLQTFWRRHRVSVSAALGVFIAVVVGAIATTLAWLETRDQRDRATQLSRELRDSVGRAERAQGRAEAASASSAAVTDFLTDLLALTNPEYGANISKRAMLDYAAEQVATRFVGQPRAEAQARTVIGNAYATLSENELVIEHLERALALREAQPDVTPLEIHEITWGLRWPHTLTGRTRRGTQMRLRGLSTAIDSFVDGLPELARGLHALRGERRFDDDFVRDLDSLLALAERKLPAGDSRWVVIGDFLSLLAEDGAIHLNAGLLEPVGTAWLDRIPLIYEQHAGLLNTNMRLIRCAVFRVMILSANGDHQEAVEAAEVAQRTMLSVLGPEHWFDNLRRTFLAKSLIAMGEVARGADLMDETIGRTLRSQPLSVHQSDLFRVAVLANEQSGRLERVPELRRELVSALVTSMELPRHMLGPALGPEHRDLVAQEEACWKLCSEAREVTPELLAYVDECRRRFAIGSGEAVVVGTALLWYGQILSGQRELIPVLEYCFEAALEGSSPKLLVACRMLAEIHLTSGDVERALQIIERGMNQHSGRQAEYFNGNLMLTRGHCLDLLEREGAEQALRAGYAQCSAVVGEAFLKEYAYVRDFYLRRGRITEALTFAAERLERLRRQGSRPSWMMHAAWSIVQHAECSVHQAAAALRAARRALVLEPDNTFYRRVLAGALFRRGEPSQALAELDQIERLNTEQGEIPAISHELLRTALLARLGHRATAEATLEAVEKRWSEEHAENLWMRRMLSEAKAAVGAR